MGLMDLCETTQWTRYHDFGIYTNSSERGHIQLASDKAE